MTNRRKSAVQTAPTSRVIEVRYEPRLNEAAVGLAIAQTTLPYLAMIGGFAVLIALTEPPVLGPLFAVAFWLFWYVLGLAGWIRRNRSIGSRVERFDERGYIAVIRGVEARVPWQKFQRASRRGSLVLLRAGRSYIWIPVRAFTAEQLARLEDLFRENGL